MAPPGRGAGWVLLPVLLMQPALALAQPATTPKQGIYSCVTGDGRRLTADRPIPECAAREQQIHNRDGSVRAILPPTLTATERAEKEARDRAAAEARAAEVDAVRRDRNLVARYPNEAAHQRAREAALDTVRIATRATEARLVDLAAERKPLLDEAEFYQGRALPPKLKAAIDGNDASVAAQRQAQATQEAERARINRNFDSELERLRRLWAGAPAGSMGPLIITPTPVPAPVLVAPLPARGGSGSSARPPARPAAPPTAAPAPAAARPASPPTSASPSSATQSPTLPPSSTPSPR